MAPTAFGDGNRLFTEFKGALTENYVLQTLVTQFEVVPRYWTQTNPPYEVDFLIQRENDIFPVEVKAEANTTSKSLQKFKQLFSDKVKLRIRFSLDLSRRHRIHPWRCFIRYRAQPPYLPHNFPCVRGRGQRIAGGRHSPVRTVKFL